MELSQLRYFYEVAKQGSFTAASRSLRVSQPSVSKMVRQLERNEGYDFFERGKAGVRLTPMGQILFEGCNRIFEEFGSLRRSLESRKEECAGELWVGASDNLCNYLFPDAVALFLKRYPKVEIKMFSGVADAIQRGIREYQLELGFFYTPIKGSELEAEKIASVEFAMVTAPQRNRAIASVKALREVGYVGSLSTDYRGPYPAQKMLKELGMPLKPLVEVNNQETQKRLVMSGVGFTVLPVHMVRTEIAEGKLLRIKGQKAISASVYLVKRRKRTLSKVAEIWAGHFREAIKG